jgi:hypothetical protein
VSGRKLIVSGRPLIVNHLEGKVEGRFLGVASYKHFLHSLSRNRSDQIAKGKVSYEMSDLLPLMLSLPVAAPWGLMMQASAARYRTVPREPEIWNWRLA